jgi:hypothetical protein
MPLSFQVCKGDFSKYQYSKASQQPLATGEVRLSIDRFALTSNNITYAAFGDAMNYWQFFPTTGADAADGWGIIPVWGFGTVTESLHDEVRVGERF